MIENTKIELTESGTFYFNEQQPTRLCTSVNVE